MDSIAPRDAVVFAVVAARFLVPLIIPRYPLPGAVTSLLVDAGDLVVLRALLGADLTGYQPYDKALDVYALSVMMLAILRNWQSRSAVTIARVLFYYRLVGVLAFELTGWRPLLVLFPNTFEYFFLFYELVRAWWTPARLGVRPLLLAAAGIWVVVKLPQEYLLHVARMGLADVIRERLLRAPAGSGWAEGAALSLSVALPAVIAAALIMLARAVAHPEHPIRLAADPLPPSIDEPHEWANAVATGWRVFDRHLLEKVVLAAALAVIFSQIVPGMETRAAYLVGGVALIATLNSVLLLRWTRKARPVPPPLLAFLLVAIANAGFVLASDLVLRRTTAGMSAPALAFALLLVSLVVTLYDRWHPVYETRFG